MFVFRKVVSGKSLSKLFLCLFAIRKLGQWKTLSSKRKIWLGFQESVFLKNLRGKHFPKVVKKLEMSLFVDYIKFDPQTFDCYIYFVLNIYFSISSLKILFLILTLVLIFIIAICFFLIIFFIEIFYLSNLVLILLIVTYFIWINLWMLIIIILISSSFIFLKKI